MGLIKFAGEDESNGTGAAMYKNPKADDDGWQEVVYRKRYRKRKPADLAADVPANDSENVLRFHELLVRLEAEEAAKEAAKKAEALEIMGSKTSTGYSRGDDIWQRVVVYRKRDWKQKSADLAADGGVSGKIVPMVESKAEEAEAEEALASLSKAAAKIDPSHLAAFLAQLLASGYRIDPKIALWRFTFYLERAFSHVSFQWLKISPLSKLIDFPLSHIPSSVYETSADWINKLPTETHHKFVNWALGRILSSSESQVATVVELAMVLRCNPDALTPLLPMLRWRPRFQGQDKLPLIVWVLALASKGDLSGGLYSWAHVLLPLAGNYKSCSRRSMDLILQFVEIILSNPEARTILVNLPVREGERLIPPSSFEILVRLTFPASSARVKSTKRFEAVYPLLKEVALAPESATGGNTVEQIFTFSLKLAGDEGNPGLAKEAAAIAIRCVTVNVDCFKQWDILYTEHLEASVALLRKLVAELKYHSPELSSSPYHALTVNRTLNSFKLKNEKAITEGGADCSLYKEADKSCKLISRRLSRGSGDLSMPHTAALVLAAAAGAALARVSAFLY